ncbi:MAG TPA: hypothetical protein VGI19_03305 [Candidatus Cybelea sp.]|jgi:hypothetical protein
MKNLARCSTGLVPLLFVCGCSAASFAPGLTTNSQINSGEVAIRKNAHGGVFSATSSGHSTFSDCAGTTNGHFRFRGGGHASYLQRITESGKLTGREYGTRCVCSGNDTLTSLHHTGNSVTFSLGLNGSRYHDPCNNPVGFVVKKGTGQFANASGYGTVTFNCTNSGYSDTWSGTLTF